MVFSKDDIKVESLTRLILLPHRFLEYKSLLRHQWRMAKLSPNLFQKLSNLRINRCPYQSCKRREEGKGKPKEKRTSREEERRFQVAARVILKVEKKWLL